MWSSEVTNMIITGIWETLYMTLVSTLVGYVIGLPMGIILTVSDKDGIKPNAVLYKILDVIANIVRSVPFIILLVLLIPFTRLVVGKSYGSTATIVPLVIAAAPYIARMVESSLKEVDAGVIEAARSMGASNFTIITKVMLVEGGPLAADERMGRHRRGAARPALLSAGYPPGQALCAYRQRRRGADGGNSRPVQLPL